MRSINRKGSLSAQSVTHTEPSLVLRKPKVLRSFTISHFHANEQEFLVVVTKHSVLTLSIAIALCMVALAVLLFSIGSCLDRSVLIAQFFLTLGQLIAAFSTYLSFSGAADDYSRYCQRCNFWCRKVAALIANNEIFLTLNATMIERASHLNLLQEEDDDADADANAPDKDEANDEIDENK